MVLPLESQAKTTMENRLEEGIQAQVDICGMISFIGYPRSLNALGCVNKAVEM